MPAASALETEFALWLRTEPSIPQPETEYRFAPPRRWRFDYAWIQASVAVEIEGITHYGNGIGRHQSAKGFVADCEKYEAALLDGWRVSTACPEPGSKTATIPSGDRKLWTR